MALQQTNDGWHVNLARQRLRYQICQIVLIGRCGPVIPGHRCWRSQNFQRTGGGVHRGVNCQVGLKHPVEFFGAGMDVHQLLFWAGRFDQGVAAGCHFTQTRADGNDQVAGFHTSCQRRIQTNANIAGIKRVVVVKRVLKAKGIAHRQLPVFGETLQRLGSLRCPTAAAGNHQRLFCC